MIFNKLRVRIGTMLAAVLVLGLAVPTSIAVTSTAAHAAACTVIYDGIYNGLPKYDIPYGCTDDYVPGVHRCTQVYNDGVDQAVECADLYATDSGGKMIVRGVGKFYCQAADRQCWGMHVSSVLAYTSENYYGGSGFTGGGIYTCNPNPGPACPASGPENVWSGGYTLNTTPDPTGTYVNPNCVKTYSFIPRDGWNNYPNVMAVKDTHIAVHSNEWDSTDAEICFE